MHVDGSMDADPAVSTLEALLDELDRADVEHPDVAVEHESGWVLSANVDGRVIWENVEGDGAPRHLGGLERRHILTLFEALAVGDLDAVEAQPWAPGYH